MSEGHIPLHKTLFSLSYDEITDRSAASSGAAAHSHTSRKPDWHCAVISVTSLTDVCLSPDCLELECIWKACVHILPTWLGD